MKKKEKWATLLLIAAAAVAATLISTDSIVEDEADGAIPEKIDTVAVQDSTFYLDNLNPR